MPAIEWHPENRPRLLLIEGLPGVGKSTILDRMLRGHLAEEVEGNLEQRSVPGSSKPDRPLAGVDRRELTGAGSPEDNEQRIVGMMGVRMSSESHMAAKDAVALYGLFEREGIMVWIDGGWAVDALLGEQTRFHADLDIALETRLLGRLRDVLTEQGYRPVPRDDTRPWNFVLGNRAGLEVDVHAFTFDENGDGVYGPPENGDYYRAEALTGEGVIEGRPVRCISPEWLIRFHRGYALKETDFHDVKALCERFGIELPEEYR